MRSQAASRVRSQKPEASSSPEHHRWKIRASTLPKPMAKPLAKEAERKGVS
jgi:hypothetical protein